MAGLGFVEPSSFFEKGMPNAEGGESGLTFEGQNLRVLLKGGSDGLDSWGEKSSVGGKFVVYL